MKNSWDNFVKEIFPRRSNSICVAVLGKKQSGKTSFMLHLMDTLHRLNLMDAFGSNMPIEAPFKVDFIDDFLTLKKRCQMLNPDPNKRGIKRYFYFGSEMGKWLPKDQAWRNVNFIEELQTIRKDGLSFCGDAIDRVDSRALNDTHFEGCFTKYNPKNPKVAVYDNWLTGERTYLTDIPNTRIKFDTFYSANFYMEPQTPEIVNLPLNVEHEKVKTYRESGYSWDKTEYSRTEGKRASDKVLDFHFTHCLPSLNKEKDVSPPSESESV